jgi:hypothetical protein
MAGSKPVTFAAIAIGVSGTALVVTLLAVGLINQVIFAATWALPVFAGILVYVSPRLQRADFRRLTVVLRRVEEATKRAEAVESRLSTIYGDTSNLAHTPFSPVGKYEELGVGEGRRIMTGQSAVNYVTGCMTRERARLARVFVEQKTPEKLAEAILDASLDMRVFQWAGPGATLDTVPKTATQRRVEEAAAEKARLDARKKSG